mgnify:CR=1 FL=1
MRRRTFLAGLGFAALQRAGCAAKPQTTPDYVLTYADNQPAGYPTTQGAQYFADLVQQQTGGKVVIQVKANGEYGSEQQVWEQLAIGGVDFARVSLSVVTDDLPRLNVLLLPYLYRDADHMWRVLDGSIGAEFLQDFTAQGRVGLSWYDAGARSFYARQPVRRHGTAGKCFGVFCHLVGFPALFDDHGNLLFHAAFLRRCPDTGPYQRADLRARCDL